MPAWTWHRVEGVGFWRLAPFEAGTRCVAAFSSRLGGVSTGPYATLNLGGRGDDPGAIAENRRRYAAAVGFDAAALATVRQVHGTAVRQVVSPARAGDGDALLTRTAGVVLAVFSADCVPVYLLDPVRRVLALVHAGWRGSAAGVVRRALGALMAGGGDPSVVLAGIGPGAGPCCYEVDEPVMRHFPPDVLRPGRPDRPGHAYLDLWEANRRQILAAGVPVANVHLAGICTQCSPELLFSYRRGAGRTGHMAAVAQLT